MRKLKLELDDLEVTSFTSDAQKQERGTVNGHKTPVPSYHYCEVTYAGDWTCEYTCADSCNYNCGTMPTNECGGCQP